METDFPPQHRTKTGTCADCGRETRGYRVQRCRSCAKKGARNSMARAAVERFWARVPNRAEGCWEWAGERLAAGYGRLYVDGHNVSTHRFSWELHNGAIPNGMMVCHRCDNPPCVNPAHLFLGTAEDNVHDMVRKGRQGRRGPAKRDAL